MQFRERRRVIQVIRTIYDPKLKRGRSEIVGKIEKTAPILSEDLLRSCTEAEVAEIREWLAQRETLMRDETVREEAGLLANRIRQVTEYFRSHADEQAGAYAADIWLAWDDLDKAMRKAGYPHPKLADKKKKGARHEQRTEVGRSGPAAAADVLHRAEPG